MSIQFYNSLTKQKEDFKPLKKNHVGLYTCGPTVYDQPHIGNLLSYIVWDVLKRFLQSQGYKVKHIMNLTDVGHLTSDADSGEDKMEKAKDREQQTAWEIADKYIQAFKDSIAKLNILPPTKYLRATETIQEQIDFVKILEEKKFLYKTSDGLYFDTSKLKSYGKLANLQNIDLQEGARVEKNPEKKNKTDFAVWKFSPKDSKRDMEWDSPWGIGFPGWHLECSVMSRMELGDTFDIHTGGEDHLPVHHPNEMAQSEAVTGKLQANVWLHNAFLKEDGSKMAKSAGGFITLDTIQEKNINFLAFRFLVLQNHYRKPLNFTWESLEAAKQGLVALVKNIAKFANNQPKVNKGYIRFFYKALSDDLNTAKGLACIQSILGDDELKPDEKLGTIYKADEVLGLGLQDLVNKSQQISASAQELLEKRAKARLDQDFVKSDELRDKLQAMGIEVQDIAEGQEVINIKF